jgi:hypothetical protein
MKAIDCRVVLLTGTPVINYPNEIGILFNILRGYIKTWKLVLAPAKSGSSITNEKIREIFRREKNRGLCELHPQFKNAHDN